MPAAGALSNHPGAIALTRTPREAHWLASSRVSPFTALFDATYAASGTGVEATSPNIELTLTTDPDPRSSMCSPTACVRANTASRLIRITEAKMSRLL